MFALDRISDRRATIEPHKQALQDTEPACYWLDRVDRPQPTPPLAGDEEADLAIVGGGFTGLWAALQAKEDSPDRNVVLIESDRVAQGASGRNGGFADPSLTHGLSNGQRHFPEEWEEIERLARENYRGFVASLERHSIDAALEQNGTLDHGKFPRLRTMAFLPAESESIGASRPLAWSSKLHACLRDRLRVNRALWGHERS